MQEKQKQGLAWPTGQNGPEASRQGVQEDAACLAAFCSTRSDTMHLAPYFEGLAKQRQALSAVADLAHSMDSHDNTTASQSMVIGDDGQAPEGGHADEDMSTHDSWQHQLIEAIHELAEKFQALLSLPTVQVGPFWEYIAQYIPAYIAVLVSPQHP